MSNHQNLCKTFFRIFLRLENQHVRPCPSGGAQLARRHYPERSLALRYLGGVEKPKRRRNGIIANPPAPPLRTRVTVCPFNGRRLESASQTTDPRLLRQQAQGRSQLRPNVGDR